MLDMKRSCRRFSSLQTTLAAVALAASVPILPAAAAQDSSAGGAPREASTEAPSGGSDAPELTFFEPPVAGLPFSSAVRAGHFLFLSGMVGLLPGELKLVPGGIEAETLQAMEHIRDTLELRGSSLDHVVKCTIFLADMKEWAAMNGVYETFFPVHFPARSALGASGLALGARVEIECLAVIPDG